LHLDDVIEQRAFEPELDLLDRAAERATPAGTRGGARVACEELQIGGARRERGEFDGEPLHRPRGWRLLEPGPERPRDANPTGSTATPAAGCHSLRPAPPNCETTASSGNAASRPRVLSPSWRSRRCVSGSSGRTASGWAERNGASSPGRTITASPGRARVAATQETNLPFPHPTRNAERGSGNAEQASDLPASVPRSAFRVPRLITSTIPSGA